MQTHCENCGNKLTPQQQKNTIQPLLREFWKVFRIVKSKIEY